MKLSMVVMLAGAMTLSSVAFASPKVLSGAELDSVSAGSGLISSVIDTFLGTNNNNVPSDVEENGTAVAPGDGSIAVQAEGSTVTTAGAVADNHAVATNGDENVVVKNDGNVAAGLANAGTDNELDAIDQDGAGLAVNQGNDSEINVGLTFTNETTDIDTDIENEIEDVENGSAAVIGDGNTIDIYADESEVEANTNGGDIYGVVARDAKVTDSFNTKIVTTVVDVTIEDSFNVETNTLDISGQNGMSAIVNANSLLGFQAVGVNLNMTSASASVPTTTGNDSASVPVIAGNAIAITDLNQIVINNCIFASFDGISALTD